LNHFRLNIYSVDLPLQRPFNWRVLFTLLALYFFGNLAGIPLLRATQGPVEPLWFWGLATLIAAGILALSMLMAFRTGLGAPLLEGQLPTSAHLPWFRTGLALTTLLIVGGIPLSLWLNRQIDPTTYPASHLLLLASLKAGIVEELFNRFFLVSLFVWLGNRFSRNREDPPSHLVYWCAIVLAGLFFGWAHVDARLGIPHAPYGSLAALMLLSTLLGIAFGWLFWKLGIEWAIIAHFAYDAVISAGLLKVFLLAKALVWVAFLSVLILAVWLAWSVIWPNDHLRQR
jgi:membrane protease YdiL (CAAX protease family)